MSNTSYIICGVKQRGAQLGDKRTALNSSGLLEFNMLK